MGIQILFLISKLQPWNSELHIPVSRCLFTVDSPGGLEIQCNRKSSITNVLNRVLALSIIGIFSHPVLAQIPSMDTYNEGNGSKRKIVVPKAEKIITYNLSFFTKKKLSECVLSLSQILKERRWDDARSEISRLKSVRLPYFGEVDSAKIFQGRLTPDQIYELERARAELAFLLGQIDDFCLSNRVIYFSKEDLKQVSGLLYDEAVEDEVESKLRNTANNIVSEDAVQDILNDVDQAVDNAKIIDSLLSSLI